jgi:hypothetical protein
MTQSPQAANLDADLCILRDPADSPDPRWRVFLCRGYPDIRELGAFSTRAAAAVFLFEEKSRLEREGRVIHTLHLPDDCPCYRK